MQHGIGEHVRDRVRLMAGSERPWCPGLDGALSASTRHGLDSARTAILQYKAWLLLYLGRVVCWGREDSRDPNGI